MCRWKPRTRPMRAEDLSETCEESLVAAEVRAAELEAAHDDGMCRENCPFCSEPPDA